MILRFFVLGFGLMFGYSAFVNLPARSTPAVESVVLLVLLFLFLAYRAGRNVGQDATAIAIATANARGAALAASQSSAALHVHLPEDRSDRLDAARQLLADELDTEAELVDADLAAEWLADLDGLDSLGEHRAVPSSMLPQPTEGRAGATEPPAQRFLGPASDTV